MATAIDEQIAKFIIWTLYFVGLYFSLFWLSVLLFKPDSFPKKSIRNWPAVTIIMPMWNEQDNIGPTLESLKNLDYPKDKLHLIVVDDGSTDNSYKVAKSYQKEIDFQLIRQKNGGKYTALNNGLKRVITPYFACLDVDGYVKKDALKHIMRSFDNEKVAAVMPVMKVAETKTLLQKVQWLEYIMNIFLKYIIGKLDCIHVAPGPLSTYRTHVIREIGGFRKAHKTEDLEIALRLQSRHYKLRQSLEAVIYTKCPSTVKGFIAQRTRWYQGTLLNIIDYRRLLFNKDFGEFGYFYIPLVAITGFLSFLGVFVISYLFLKEFYFLLKRLFMTGFDFPTYLANFSFQFSLLDYNYQTLFTTAVLFGLIFIYIWLSFTAIGEKMNVKRAFKNSIMFLYFFFIFKFIVGYVWLKVFYRTLFKQENKWGKLQ